MKRPPGELGLDAHWIAGDLFQGAFPPMDSRVARSVDVVVFAASELQPPASDYRGVRVIYAPNDDDGYPMSERQWITAMKTARAVRLELDRGRRVLSTCHMGLNRSGLISAIALMLPPTVGARKSRTPSCLNSAQATHLVRAARGPLALSNVQFQKALARLDGRFCPGCRAVFPPGVRL